MFHSIQVSFQSYPQISSASLFNFEAEDYEHNEINIDRSTYLHLIEHKQLTKTHDKDKAKANDYMVTISHNKNPNLNTMTIEKIISAENPSMILQSNNWLVIRDTFKNEGYKLNLNDYIKFGMCIFKIVKIRLNDNDSNDPLKNECFSHYSNFKSTLQSSRISSRNSVVSSTKLKGILSPSNELDDKIVRTNTHLNSNDFNYKNELYKVKEVEEYCNTLEQESTNFRKLINNFNCRICLGDSSEETMVNICNCTGSVKYIHITCLFKWIINSIKINETPFLVYIYFTKVKCEICKKEYPQYIKVQDRIVNIYDPLLLLQYFQSNHLTLKKFIALEYIKMNPVYNASADDENMNKAAQTSIILLKYDKTTNITLGRSEDNQFRLMDNSISRNHASFILRNNAVYLKDLNSKYGTYVNFPYDVLIPLYPYHQITLMCFRYIIKISIKMTLLGKFCFCCYDSSEDESKYTKYLELHSLTVNGVDQEEKIEINCKENMNNEEMKNVNISMVERENIWKEINEQVNVNLNEDYGDDDNDDDSHRKCCDKKEITGNTDIVLHNSSRNLPGDKPKMNKGLSRNNHLENTSSVLKVTTSSINYHHFTSSNNQLLSNPTQQEINTNRTELTPTNQNR